MLSALETRIPPPFLLLVLAAVVWAFPAPTVSLWQAAVGAAAVLLGLSINAWSKGPFRRAGTTVTPLHPERASVLVTSGPYRYSRNPMYLGYALALSGCVIWQGNPLGLVAVVVFVAYVTRFQIVPEERQLSARFGAQYAAYRHAVRRWG